MNAFTATLATLALMMLANYCAHAILSTRARRKAEIEKMEAETAAVNAEIDEIIRKN